MFSLARELFHRRLLFVKVYVVARELFHRRLLLWI